MALGPLTVPCLLCSRTLRMLILFSSGAVGFVLFLEGMPLLELTEPSFFLLTTSDHKPFHSDFTLLVKGQGKHPAGVSGWWWDSRE